MEQIKQTDLGIRIQSANVGLKVYLINRAYGLILGATGKEMWGKPMFGTTGILGTTPSAYVFWRKKNIEQV